MKLTTTALIVTACIALTACSKGGSNPTNDPQASDQPSSPLTPVTSNPTAPPVTNPPVTVTPATDPVYGNTFPAGVWKSRSNYSVEIAGYVPFETTWIVGKEVVVGYMLSLDKVCYIKNFASRELDPETFEPLDTNIVSTFDGDIPTYGDYNRGMVAYANREYGNSGITSGFQDFEYVGPVTSESVISQDSSVNLCPVGYIVDADKLDFGDAFGDGTREFLDAMYERMKRPALTVPAQQAAANYVLNGGLLTDAVVQSF